MAIEFRWRAVVIYLMPLECEELHGGHSLARRPIACKSIGAISRNLTTAHNQTHFSKCKIIHRVEAFQYSPCKVAQLLQTVCTFSGWKEFRFIIWPINHSRVSIAVNFTMVFKLFNMLWKTIYVKAVRTRGKQFTE